MKQGKVIGFDAAKMAEQMMANAVTEQNRRLVDYAKEEIKKLGDMIQTYTSKNHMDRTGNLLNSLCWVVTYEGNGISFKESGFYREETLHGKGMQGTSESFLHEFFTNDMEEVNGRRLAEEFIKSFKGVSHKWKVAFAVLAPYWGFWESGFTMKMGGGTVYKGYNQEHAIPQTTRFLQFRVMSHIYDDVRMALKPAETHITVYVPKYIYKSQKWKKKLKNRVGVKKIGTLR